MRLESEIEGDAMQTKDAQPAADRKSERGYVLLLTAILLVPLMGIAAVGVDFGVWYLQASRNQSAADAAALAGAVWLPDDVRATNAAMEALERNGYDIGVDSSATVEVLGSSNLRVTVASKSELSFSSLFIDDFAITRSSVGTYIPPTAIGSPTNSLGEEGLWLAISGECSVRENGDLLAARTVAGYTGGTWPPASCAAAPVNPDYTDGDYFLAVEVAVPTATPIVVQVYDGTYAPSPTKTTDLEFRPPSNFSTTFTLYDVDGSVFDPTSGSVIASRTYGTNSAAADSVWTNVGTITAPEVGIYYLRVSTNGSGGLNSWGSNGFAVRAGLGTPFTACTTLIGQAGYSANCPQVYAVEHLPLYASLSNGTSEFYLAEVPAGQAGKQLEISLFDVGEGAERIEILDPNGNPYAFTWQTDCSITSPAIGCSGVSESWMNPTTNTLLPHTLDVSGTGNQIYANTLSSSLWNDRTVILTVDIPNNYDTAYTGRWWRVRYTFGDDITDRTTWSVRVIGDPVRLTD